jgi:hypothetical protein
LTVPDSLLYTTTPLDSTRLDSQQYWYILFE